MANTGYARTSYFPQRYRGHLAERHATGSDWEVMEVWEVTPPTTEPWHAALYCTADIDTGATGELRLRSSSGPACPPVPVSAFARNVRLGFEGIPQGPQLIYVEGRRTAGTGGVRLIKSAATILSAPPAALVTGSLALASTALRGWFLNPGSSNSLTIDSSSFVDANGPVTPQVGDQVLLIVSAPGPADVVSPTFSIPGKEVFFAQSNNFRPRLIGRQVTYTTPTTWVVSSSTSFRLGALLYGGIGALRAGQPFSETTPTDIIGVSNPANSVGVALSTLNFTGGAVTAPSAGHITRFNSGSGVRQLHAASASLATAGFYDPSAPTVGPGNEQGTVIAVVATPTTGASIPEPTIPTFNAGSAITINPGDNAAAIVAAQPAGTHFNVAPGIHTNWDDVRPKANMHFRGAGTSTVLEGTGKGYCFRGLDQNANGVTIGRMKIQNYGNGTDRQEFGAINPYPSNWLGGQFTYNHPDGWFVYDVELSRNSSNGIYLSDNCTCLRVTSYGHTVTGIGGDRVVGGLLYDCTLAANALDPATGTAENGANAKFTHINADAGRTSIVTLLRPKAQFSVINCTFEATRPGINGSCAIGLWFDLDCQRTLIEGCTFTNHGSVGLFWEGCNNGVARLNTVTNSDGYGDSVGAGANFINGGICVGESTNIIVEDNTIVDCVRALINRMSGRPDWTAVGDIADPAGTRFWLNNAGPAPIPSPLDWSNIWTGNNTFRNNRLVNCQRVIINEGTASARHNPVNSTDLASIRFVGNDYGQSPWLLFYHLNNTGESLTTWRARSPLYRDQ